MSETSKPVSVEPEDAWADVVEARRAARDRKARRRWLVAGVLVAAGLGAAIAIGTMGPRETPPPAGASRPEPPPAVTAQVTPTVATSPTPEPPATSAQTSAAASGSPSTSSAALPPSSSKPALSAPRGPAPKPPPPKATAQPGASDPFGDKYD